MSSQAAGGRGKGKAVVETDDDSDYSLLDSESSLSDSNSPPAKKRRKGSSVLADKGRGRKKATGNKGKGKRSLREGGTASKQEENKQRGVVKKLANKAALSSQSPAVTSPSCLGDSEPNIKCEAQCEHDVKTAIEPAVKRMKLSHAINQNEERKMDISPVIVIEDEGEVCAGGDAEGDGGGASASQRKRRVLLYSKHVACY